MALVGGVAKRDAWELVNHTFVNFCEPHICPPSLPAMKPQILGIQGQELYLPRL
ncbi:hypothetical protein RintRC_2129 [Richelia intracellularis]|nr:hypothetical protein RintRC_2129 [Richelia intracellularis]